MIELLEVGSMVVNDTIGHYAVSTLPFGGVKRSGTARTHGKQDVLQFTQTKAYGIGGTPVFLDVAAMLRRPNNYGLMSAIFHLPFGVTPEQRLRPVTQGVEEAAGAARRSPKRAAALAAVTAGLAAVAVSLLRSRD